MGLLQKFSIFCILCVFPVTTEWENFRVMQDVTFMKSGTEFTRIVDSSPTGVIRALNNIHVRLHMKPKLIVTEKVFENIVKGWPSQFHADISNRTVLEYQICWYNLSYSYKPNEFIFPSRIFLLTPEKLKHWIAIFQKHDYNPVTDIIIGTCFPKFFINKSGVNILIPVQTKHWIYPSNSKYTQRHWTNRDNLPFLVQHTSLHNWRAISLEYHLDLCRVNNQTRHLYGALQHFSIRSLIGPVKDSLGFPKVKDGKPAGFLASFVESIFEYLQLTLYWGYVDEKGNEHTNYKHNWSEDMIDVMFLLCHDTGKHTWPPLFRDGLTVLAKMQTRSMTLARLISLFKYNVWAAAIVILLLLNLGFSFAFDGSPSLKNNPKLKHKSMSKAMRILLFDSLIRFKEEWSAGPTKSVRILLMAFNIYLFLTLNAFLAIFSVQILSRSYFPLNSFYDVHQYQRDCYMDADANSNLRTYKDISSQCGWKEGNIAIAFYNYLNASHTNLECLIKDKCIIITHSKRANMAVNRYPGVHHIKKPEQISGISILFGKERMFENSFSKLTLRLRENGILQILQERYFKMYGKSDDMPEAINFADTWLTMSILAIGILAAALIVVAENLIPNDNIQTSSKLPAK